MEEQFSSEDTFYMLILMQSQNSTSGTYREPHCMLKKVDFLQYLSFNISEITDLVHMNHKWHKIYHLGTELK